MLILAIVLGAIILPLGWKAATHTIPDLAYYEASMESSGLTPAPLEEPQAIIQVMAAPTFSWRGIFAVHSWIVTRQSGAEFATRYDVVGWGGGSVIRKNYALPDAKWYSQMPEVLLDMRGAEAEALIPQIEEAITSYPWPQTYKSYPGPNSNTFIAHIARSVPALKLDLPTTAIGKDYRPLSNPIGTPPSGSGLHLSAGGLAGLTLSPVEGVEVNLLGLSLGLDLSPPALRLPGIGRLGFSGTTTLTPTDIPGIEKPKVENLTPEKP